MLKKTIAVSALALTLVSVLCGCGLTDTVAGLFHRDAGVDNTAIESVTLPSDGKLRSDYTTEVEGVTYRQVFYRKITTGEVKAYAQELYNIGYEKVYEDASDSWYGFSANYPSGVAVSASWTEDGLSLTFADAKDAAKLIAADKERAASEAAKTTGTDANAGAASGSASAGGAATEGADTAAP